MFTITPAAPADVPAAATVLAEAFERDTVMASLTSWGERPRARLTELFGALMRSRSACCAKRRPPGWTCPVT